MSVPVLMRSLLAALILLSGPVSRADEGGGGRHLIVVIGLGGESYYQELFQGWASSLYQVARQRLHLSREEITVLAPPGAMAAEMEAGVATRDGVLAAIAAASARTGPGDLVALILIGHGSAQPEADGVRARFNLPGPDLSPAQLARALQPLSDRTVVVVNGASASGPFLAPLAAPGRIVITATSSAAENQHARFMGHFVAALAEDAADMDKDTEISVLEAFTYASRAVGRDFASQQRLQTEHAVLDDSGDGVGSRAPVAGGEAGDVDGALASRVMLASRQRSPMTDGEGTRARLRLDLQARQLVEGVQALKRRKGSLEEPVYQQRLEALLVELALNRRALRARSGP